MTTADDMILLGKFLTRLRRALKQAAKYKYLVEAYSQEVPIKVSLSKVNYMYSQPEYPRVEDEAAEDDDR